MDRGNEARFVGWAKSRCCRMHGGLSPSAPKGEQERLEAQSLHDRSDCHRRQIGQYWFQDGRKFAQCFQDSARSILSKIDQDGHPLSSPVGSSLRGYPVSFDRAAGSFRRIARGHRSGALAVNRPIRSSRSRWFRRQKDTTIIDANDLRISKMVGRFVDTANGGQNGQHVHGSRRASILA